MEYRILGPIEVLDADGKRVELGGPKQRALLALLLCEAGRVVSLDRIIDELWGDQPPPAATGTLQAYVSVLRRALEPDRKPRQPARILLTAPPGYRLHIEPAEVDAHRFELFLTTAQELLASDEIERAERVLGDALSLWRGDALADVAHERFAQAEIARLAELRYAALEARTGAQLALGRHALVIPQLERLVADHPLREGLRAQLILALYQAGRQADALQAYQETRRMLADELGIDPSPELQQLEADILGQSDRIRLRPRPREQLAVTLDAEPELAEPELVEPELVDERPFVGRDKELAALQRAVARARDGAGGLVLVSGEAGIGKSSLAEAAAEHARSLGMVVAVGVCAERQASMWFWPWVQIARDVRAAFQAMGDDTSALTEMLRTDWQSIIADTEDPVDAEGRRFRLYDQVARDIEARATRRPGLFVFDDIHWADRSSLDLLRFVAPRLAKLPLLVVATFRSEEITAGDALDETLGWLMRERAVTRIHLDGLGVEDIARYLDAVGTRSEGVLPVALHDRTDGNPFYLVELMRLLTSEGVIGSERSPLPHVMESLPLSVQDVIRRRVGRLPEDTRAILGVASVAGRDFPVELLAGAARVELDRALDLLEPALVTRVLTEDPQPGRLRFSHALVRETLAASLSPLQRARLHLRVGEALEQHYQDVPDAPHAEMAHHFVRAITAGGATRALAHAREAAKLATASLAYHEAAGHWRNALDAIVVAAPRDLEGRMDILFELGLALRRDGDVVGGWERMQELIDLALAAGDEVRAVRAAVSFGGIDLWNWRDYGEVDQRVVELLEASLTWVPERAPDLHARVLATLAVELAYGDRRADGEAYGRRAVELTRDNHPILHARALNASFLAAWRPGTEDERLAAMDEYLGLADHMSEEVETVGRLHRLFLRLRNGDLAGFGEDVRRITELAGKVRDPDLRAQIACVGLMRMTLGARWQDAETMLARLDEQARGTSLWGFGWVRVVQLLSIMRQQGDAPLAWDGFEQLAASPTTELLRPLYALGLIEAGRVEDARRIVVLAPPQVARDWAWEFTTVAWAEVAAELGTPDPSRAFELLAPLADRIVVAGTCIACWGSMHGTLGRLARRLGRSDEAVTHLRAALATDQHLGAPGLEARTRVDLATVLLETGAREEAALVLNPARELTALHGLGLGSRIQRLLEQLA